MQKTKDTKKLRAGIPLSLEEKKPKVKKGKKTFLRAGAIVIYMGKWGRSGKFFLSPLFSLEAIFVPSGFLYVGKGKETASLYLKEGGKNSRFGIALQIRCEKK